MPKLLGQYEDIVYKKIYKILAHTITFNIIVFNHRKQGTSISKS